MVNAWSFAAIPFLLLNVQAKGMSSTNSALVMVHTDQYKGKSKAHERGSFRSSSHMWVECRCCRFWLDNKGAEDC